MVLGTLVTQGKLAPAGCPMTSMYDKTRNLSGNQCSGKKRSKIRINLRKKHICTSIKFSPLEIAAEKQMCGFGVSMKRRFL